MALVECKECKHQVSSKAKTCPNCGFKISTSFGFLGWILIIFSTMFVFSLLGNKPQKNNDSSEIDAPAQDNITAPVINSWQYSDSTDSMASGIVKTATIRSDNVIELHAPYSGGTFGNLVIRKHPRWGLDVMFTINQGQLMCSYNDCKLNIRFDEQKYRTFTATEPDDHSSDTLFIRDKENFIKNLKKSKKVTIEATFYRNGSNGFKFNTENLDF